MDFAAKKEDSIVHPPSRNLSGDPYYCKRSEQRRRYADRLPAVVFLLKSMPCTQTMWKDIIKANWGAADDEKNEFISTPSKLVVTALACKETQSPIASRSVLGSSFNDYSIIRMDTNRMVEDRPIKKFVFSVSMGELTCLTIFR